MATAEPEGSSQGAQQVLSAATVTFSGCSSTAVPSLTLKDLKAINFTTFTWTLNHTVLTSKGVNLLPPLNDSSSSSASSSASSSSTSDKASSAPSVASTAAATATSAAAVNASASAFLSRSAPGVLVIPRGKDVSESLTVVSEITRLPGVEGGLFGLEGQLVASAPGKEPLEVAGERGEGGRGGGRGALRGGVMGRENRVRVETGANV